MLNSTACLNCPFDTYYGRPGATSSTYCTKCPNGLRTSSSGQTSIAACISIPYICPLGTQSNLIPAVSINDCVPIQCPSHLQMSSTGDGCEGCPSGTYGIYPSQCNDCIANYSCPGFLSMLVPNNAAVLMDSLTSGVAVQPLLTTPLCIAAARAPSVAVKLTSEVFAITDTPSSLALATGGLAITLIFLLLTVNRVCPRSTLSRNLKASLRLADAFSLEHSLAERQIPVNVTTPLGGACTITSILVFVTFAIILGIRFATDNILVISTIDSAAPGVISPFTDSKWAFWSLKTESLTPPLRGSIQLRFFSQVGSGCSVPIGGITTVGAGVGGVWSLATVPDCGDGRSLLTFTCAQCSLSAGAYISFALPFTCQALYLEALAFDATGALSILSFPPEESVATPNELISSLSWTINVLAAVVDDSIHARVVRGFRLLEGPTGTTYSRSGGVLLPLPASVSLVIRLPLATTFSITMISQRVTFAELLSSIVGLAGIMAAFKLIFRLAEDSYRANKVCCSSKQRRAGGGGGNVSGRGNSSTSVLQSRPSVHSLKATASPPKVIGDEDESGGIGGGNEAAEINPLWIHKGGGNDENDEEVISQWEMCGADGTVWYKHRKTGELRWLPPENASNKGGKNMPDERIWYSRFDAESSWFENSVTGAIVYEFG